MGRGEGPSKEPPGGVHAGHRGRMRRRFLISGLEGFEDHEVLELLLFYAIPRRDVNATAHRLINRFGNLSGVLDAPEGELCAVPGIGPRTAHFLNLIPQVLAQLRRQQSLAPKIIPVQTIKDLQAYLSQYAPDGPVGQLLIIFADANCNAVSLHRCASFDALAIRDVAIWAVNTRAALTILVERVEDCDDFPPPGRCQALDQLAEKLSILQIPLRDYLTVDALGHRPHSYARSGQLLPR